MIRILLVLVALLLASPIVRAGSFEPPSMSLAQAAGIAEAELVKRGLAADHCIVSLWLMPPDKQSARYYSAHITPPVPFADPSVSADTKPVRFLELHIDLSGVVTAVAHQFRDAPSNFKLQVREPR